MIKKGVPKQAVINKMMMESVDPTILDNNYNSDEYIVVDGIEPRPPPPPFPPPPPPPPTSLSINNTNLNESNKMGHVFNELLGGNKRLKKVKEGEKNKFKRRRRSKSKLSGSYTPSLNEILNMKDSLKKTNSKSRLKYLELD